MATISGTSGDDVLNGTPAADVMRGLAGNDRLAGGAGNDLLAGGDGIDTAVYGGRQSGHAVGVTATGEVVVRDTDPSDGDDGTDTLVGIENLTGSQFNDTLTGSGLANVLDGGAGNAILTT